MPRSSERSAPIRLEEGSERTRTLPMIALLAILGAAVALPAWAQSDDDPSEASPQPTSLFKEGARTIDRSAAILTTASVSQISSLSPDSGPASGGSGVTIRGNFFQAGSTVKVGGINATVLSIPSATQINVAMPALPAGTLADIVISSPSGKTGTLPEGWFVNFTDVPAGNAYHDYVEQLVRLHVTAGVGGGNYGLTSGITRAQMAVFLLRAKYGPNFTPPPATGTIFADVGAGSFAAAWIEQLYRDGVTGGCSTTPLNYCPSSSITIEQMSVFVLRGAHGITYTPPPATGQFADLPATSGFAPWGEQVSREGIYTGQSPTSFGTGLPVTRDVMAMMVIRGFQEGDIIRFLEQATWGPTSTLIQQVQATGIKAWLNQQFGLPSGSWPNLALFPSNVPGSCNSQCQTLNYTMYPLQQKFFLKAMYDQDQLRQRVAWALHELIIISGIDIQQPSWVSPYMQILDSHAFGNYRDILYQVSLNAGMGHYLNVDTSTKFSPNENYGREINQLFSIGLNLTNNDGTEQLDPNGDPIPTYNQTIIDNFALVFTGWYIANASPGVPDYISPMSLNTGNHDVSVKTLLNGFSLGSNQTGDQDLNGAIDNIFTHPNLGPYVARHLIQSLVTSNPSPGYIERVADVFNDDGTGLRGNLQAVVQTILLDPEARGAFKTDPLYGQLKEPAVLMTQILRAFNAKSANLTSQSDGVLASQAQSMSQDILKPPTVFSYFPADFAVPGTSNASGPEFGIYTASESLKRANFINTMVFATVPVSNPNVPKGTALDFSAWLPYSDNANVLVAELNRVLMHNTMSAQMQTAIVNAVNAVGTTNPSLRVKQAVYLVLTSSQFQVKR